jgi:hypothetical protein
MRYDRHQIGQYDFEEMKEAIWPNLQALDVLRRTINETEQPSASARENPKRKSA